MRRWTILLLALATAASVASANPGGSRPDTPAPSNPTLPSGTSAQATGPRQEAEQLYGLAYEEVAKANKDLASGKSKNAEKKLRRALERAERAVALDVSYHEAWNLVGYCARKTGDYAKALAAYGKCLAIKWDYAPAREYLGEAYLEKDDPKKAREQLVMLERVNASEEAGELRAKIEAYEAAHPAAADSAAAPVAAPADTAASGGR